MNKTPLVNICRNITENFLASTSLPAPPLTIAQRELVTNGLMGDIVNVVGHINQDLPKGAHYRIPDNLPAAQIAELILHFEPVANIIMSNTNSDQTQLALYMTDGPKAGTYSTHDKDIIKVIKLWDSGANKTKMSEIIAALSVDAPVKYRTNDPDLVPINNGIFNYRTKTLMPFSQDMVFLSKCRVDYVQTVTNPVIHNSDDGTDWDVESWMATLSDDPEVVSLLWEIIGAVVRPNVRWNKAIWFYSTLGNNGKGTLCSLMRNLIGLDSCASISIKDFGRNFQLGDLVKATAIITDENDVGELNENLAALKAVITQDVFKIEKKHENPFPFQFYGLMVQCFNSYPYVRDRSGSFYRRILLVPFEKCFTGAERMYIKDDYLKRQEVLEYVLHKVLHTAYYKLSEPDACRMLLNEYQTVSDPFAAFLDEMLDQFTWDLVPFNFMYDLYKSWLQRNYPRSVPLSDKKFSLNLQEWFKSNTPTDWIYPKKCGTGKNKKFQQIDSANRMTRPEHLIYEYNLNNWKNPSYVIGSNIDKMCCPVLKPKYRGIYRNINTPSGAALDDEDEG